MALPHLQNGVAISKKAYFCCRSFRIYEQNLLRIRDNPVFRLVAILKSISKIFEKQLQRNLFLNSVVPNLSTNISDEIYILESCPVSINKIFEINL